MKLESPEGERVVEIWYWLVVLLAVVRLKFERVRGGDGWGREETEEG